MTIMILLLTKSKRISKWETAEQVYFRKGEKNRVIFFVSLHICIFDFISIKWKMFHHSHLFPGSAKILINFLHFFIYIVDYI